MKSALCVLVASALLAGVISLAGCATPPPPAPQATIGFIGAPLRLEVAQITIDNRYQPPGKAPNVEQLHEVTPSTVARRWLETRVVPVGTSGQGVLKIIDASVVQEKLPIKGGITGFFGDQVDSKLVGKLRVELIVATGQGVGKAVTTYKVNVMADAEQTILQSATLNDRDSAYFTLMQNLANQFDKTATSEVNRVMSSALAR